jgi:hypothetical protein
MKFNSIRLFLLLSFSSLLFACGSNSTNDPTKTNATHVESAFNKVNGIRFFEVKRRFRNGLSFNKDGFQHEPRWIIQFKAPDTMMAYSPEHGFEAFYLQFDHGQVYNFANEFFRAIYIGKDSLVLQRLQVDGKVIAGNDDVRSDVYSTYYTKDFIENKLHTTIGEIQKPTRADTLYIKQLAAKAAKEPSNPETAFAAREPVVFIPKGKFVTVEKISTFDKNNYRTYSYDYMYPQYKIKILKSYKAFNYSFSVIVATNGKMYVNRVDGVMPDDVPPRKRLLQGITDVYLQNLFKIEAGKTLGVPHGSEVTIYLTGVTNQ